MKKKTSKKKATPAKKVKKAAVKTKKAVGKSKVKAKKPLKKSSPPAKKTTTAKTSAKVKGPKKAAKKDFPGYPKHTQREDIMNKKNKSKKVLLDEEKMHLTSTIKKQKPVNNKTDSDLNEFPFTYADEEAETKGETDVTKEEIEILGNDELNSDMGDDDELRKRVWPVDISGSDLDVPGADDDDESEAIGEEDEENNNFSIGGDRHDDLEEDKDLGM